VNIIILWNTLYINAALEQLASEGFAIQTEDIARLSPLVFEHLHLLGRYAFSVPDSVVRGQLRLCLAKIETELYRRIKWLRHRCVPGLSSITVTAVPDQTSDR
jgi:hypothetical protein